MNTFPIRLFLNFLKNKNIISQDSKLMKLRFNDKDNSLDISIFDKNKEDNLIDTYYYLSNKMIDLHIDKVNSKFFMISYLNSGYIQKYIEIINQFFNEINKEYISFDEIEFENQINAYYVVEKDNELFIKDTHYDKNDDFFVEPDGEISIIDYQGITTNLFKSKKEALQYCKNRYDELIRFKLYEVDKIKNFKKKIDNISV